VPGSLDELFTAPPATCRWRRAASAQERRPRRVSYQQHGEPHRHHPDWPPSSDDNALWSAFVNVSLILTRQPILVVPQAVQSGQKGQYVFVSADQTVELRPVVPGATDGRDLVIANGLKAGELVVTDGQLRLVPGARVDVKPAAPAGPVPSKTGGG
jgi:hypothetical protein